MDILFSFKTTLILLATLAIGAAVATFIENDFGTSTARVLVYNNIWYEFALALTIVNMSGIIYKYKMWKHKPRFIFHTAFVVILIGAATTRYVGYEGIIHIREGKTENRMISLEPYLQVKIKQEGGSYYKEFLLELTALGSNDFTHNIKFNGKELTVKFNEYLYSKEGRKTDSVLVIDAILNGQTKTIKLPGKRGGKGISKLEDFGDTIITFEYGSKVLALPFSIHLKDFQLDRYPGSMAPSSYASEITVNREDGSKYDYRIFMNKTLHQGNFLFFQSSYDQDEKGTVLSVNNDPGKWPTYLGYFLLTVGLILNLFDKKSRFWKLTNYVNKQNTAAIIMACMFAFQPSNLQAADAANSLDFNITKNDIVSYLKNYKDTSKISADKFSRIVVQSSNGRMKPLNTLNKEIVYKLTSKSSMFGMNSDQIILGMLTRPEVWRNVKMIKIKTPKLKNILSVESSRKYISFSEVFKAGEYLLQDEAQKAFRTKPNERGTFERDIIALDEKLNVAYMVYNGNLFNMFPQIGKNDNNKWYTPLDSMKTFTGENKKAVESMIRGFINSIIDENWDIANKFLDIIVQYQEKAGVKVIPSKTQIEQEIAFNNFDVFPKVTVAYIILGFIMLIVAFIVVFNPKIKPKKTTFVFFILLSILFALHTFGMGFRWIVSGHAPWSDTYESLLYISWSAVFAGIIFFRKSMLALSAAVIVAGIFMFTAHLTGINPQITNLVPVLKSYWLTIHVSILTASYGFFGLGAILGYMSLIMYIFRKNRPHLDNTIKHITAINEIALIVGLSALTIGNFLGGVWANESWGRYWGWDPKETWAYVSIVFYVLVLHLRFVKKLNTPFVFSVASLLAFASILMTYFGVNFYLSGMHSYATGDPVPVPMWVYYMTAVVFITIALAYKNRNLKDEICHK
jgi:cytochrome c-type biogenesis protein CcsB